MSPRIDAAHCVALGTGYDRLIGLVRLRVLVQWRQWCVALPHEPAAEEPREPDLQLVRGMLSRWDGKNEVKLLQCLLHGLWHNEKDHDECDQIQSRIEAESPRGSDLRKQCWECDRERASDRVVDADCEGRANLTVR